MLHGRKTSQVAKTGIDSARSAQSERCAHPHQSVAEVMYGHRIKQAATLRTRWSANSSLQAKRCGGSHAAHRRRLTKPLDRDEDQAGTVGGAAPRLAAQLRAVVFLVQMVRQPFAVRCVDFHRISWLCTMNSLTSVFAKSAAAWDPVTRTSPPASANCRMTRTSDCALPGGINSCFLLLAKFSTANIRCTRDAKPRSRLRAALVEVQFVDHPLE